MGKKSSSEFQGFEVQFSGEDSKINLRWGQESTKVGREFWPYPSCRTIPEMYMYRIAFLCIFSVERDFLVDTELAEMGSLGECSSNSSMGSMGAKVPVSCKFVETRNSPLTDLFEQHSLISLPQKLETCLVSGNDFRFERKERMEALDYWHFTVLCLSLVVKNATCLDVLVTSVHPCHFARCEPGRVRCAVVMSQGSSPVTICWSRCITRQHRRVSFRWLKEGLMKTWKHETCSKLMQSSQGGAPLVSSSGQKLDIDLFTLMWVGCTAAS